MAARPFHTERHLVHRIGRLRAAILGANDGIVSTASLIVGVASAAAQLESIEPYPQSALCHDQSKTSLYC